MRERRKGKQRGEGNGRERKGEGKRREKGREVRGADPTNILA